jgi:hypothetical protein
VLIKLILVGCLLTLGWLLFRGPGTAGQTAVRRLLSTLMAVSGILTVLFPDSLTWLANRLGVGRGTDLLLYGLVVAFLFTTFALYRRLRQLEERIVHLTRELAIRPDSVDGSATRPR